MRAFASALDAVPLALAENSGLSPIVTLTDVRSRQVNENNSRLGIDCNGRGQNGMMELISKDTILSKLSRYEGAACVRPPHFQATTIPACYSAGPRRPQNRYVNVVFGNQYLIFSPRRRRDCVRCIRRLDSFIQRKSTSNAYISGRRTNW